MILIPRPYQLEGIEWLASKRRAMLVDAPGLGKTLQAAEAAIKPVLISAPSYLTEHWAEFIYEQFPGDSISLAMGDRTRRTKTLQRDADWYIINHQMLRTYDMPKGIQTFIVDESHHMKSHKAEMSQYALIIALQVPRVYLLTATPIIREPDDLFMQLRLLDPVTFDNYERFVSAFCNRTWGPFQFEIHGLKRGTNFNKIYAGYSLGRTYEQVKLDLPELIESKLILTPPPDFIAKYRKAKTDYLLDDRVLNSPLEVLRELRRMTVCPQKVDAIKALLEDSPGKSVVFCWYRDTAALLGEALNAPVITGALKPSDRRMLALKRNDCIVATIASLSEGVDLSFCRTVVFAEQDYTPGRLHQAISRVHRFSADVTPVRVFYALMKGTVDEVIHHCVDRRISSVYEVLAMALKEETYLAKDLEVKHAVEDESGALVGELQADNAHGGDRV